MTTLRLLAIGFIFLCTAVAWSILGSTVVGRTGERDGRLSQEVAQLWGGHHVQVAPQVAVRRPREVGEEVKEQDAKGGTVIRTVKRTVIEEASFPAVSSRVRVDLGLEHRRKGLLWYDTYTVDFQADYRFVSPDPVEREVVVRFDFPSKEAIYDAFGVSLNGRQAPLTTDFSNGVTLTERVAPGEELVLHVAYRSRGLGEWAYAFVKEGVAHVRDFELTMTTDFEGVDFPAGTISPTEKVHTDKGWTLKWVFESLAAGKRIGIDPPNLLNPGPVTARITFFAPVSLLFFLTVMVILGVLSGRSLHPMNYFFLSAAFFAFHLLLAYLVDHMELNAAFAIAAAASVFLVVSYLRVVAGMRTALVQAGLAQLVFLVLFSYAFFFEGYTGLTVALGAVLTLFVLMQLTARVDWGAVFAKR
jgi:inner membrane protein involved in colicin E2 resistance